VLSTFLSFGVVESCISFMAVFPSGTYYQVYQGGRWLILTCLCKRCNSYILTVHFIPFYTDFESNEVCLVHLQIHFSECVWIHSTATEISIMLLIWSSILYTVM
jgi:hypothetical protein